MKHGNSYQPVLEISLSVKYINSFPSHKDPEMLVLSSLFRSLEPREVKVSCPKIHRLRNETRPMPFHSLHSSLPNYPG